MGSGRRIAVMLGTVGALLSVSTTIALASVRYASPDGTNQAPCTLQLPCDIVTAIDNAPANSNITLNPGTYGSPAPIATGLTDKGHDLNIHGIAGESRPVIDTTATHGLSLSGGSTLSEVDVEDTSSSAGAAAIWVTTAPATISDVIAHVSGPNGIACSTEGALIDSVCWSQGTDGVAATAPSPPPLTTSVAATLRNDTLSASGTGGDAVQLNGASLTTTEMDLYNTIARGAGEDILVQSSPSDATGSVIVTAHDSNFATTKQGSGGGTFTLPSSSTNGSQSAEPVLVDATAGNFHELSGSPTIGAGGDSSLNGAADLDGNPREVGGKTDIGAFQYIAGPSCTPGVATTKFATATRLQLACTDPLGGVLTYAITGGPNHGTASVNAATGLVTYTPAAGFSGSDSFDYTASSSNLTASEQVVTITVGKEPPPTLSHFRQSKGTFAFRLSEAAKATLTFTQRAGGQTKSRGSITLNAKLGANSVRFTGKLPDRKELKPGAYIVVLSATNPGGEAKAQSLRFTIKAPPPKNKKRKPKQHHSG
jgi:large repetitive protein